MENRSNRTLHQAGAIVSLFCFLWLVSCGNDNKVIASVGDKELTENEAYILMKYQNINPDDKEAYRAFVEKWCENEALKAELKTTYPDEWQLVELRGDYFTGELAKLYLEESSLNTKLDTIVEMEEIKAYYDEHKDEFILQDYIVKALYLKIPAQLDYKEEKIQQHYLLKNDKDLITINSYAKLYAENYHFNDSTWTYFNDVVKDVPETKYNEDYLVLNRGKTYFSDENFTYFINIIDYKLKDEAPPVEFLKEEIKNIIVANRLQRLIEKEEPEMIRSIKKKHEININI